MDNNPQSKKPNPILKNTMSGFNGLVTGIFDFTHYSSYHSYRKSIARLSLLLMAIVLFWLFGGFLSPYSQRNLLSSLLVFLMAIYLFSYYWINSKARLLKRLYPAYDRFVDRFGQAALERHIKYVGTHTSQKPDKLVPYMLKVLTDFESQLNQPQPKPVKHAKSGRAQISEELPEWAAHPENIKNKQPSPEKLAKIDQMLAELENGKEIR